MGGVQDPAFPLIAVAQCGCLLQALTHTGHPIGEHRHSIAEITPFEILEHLLSVADRSAAAQWRPVELFQVVLGTPGREVWVIVPPMTWGSMIVDLELARSLVAFIGGSCSLVELSSMTGRAYAGQSLRRGLARVRQRPGWGARAAW